MSAAPISTFIPIEQPNSPRENADSIDGIKWVEAGEPVLNSVMNRPSRAIQSNMNLVFSALNQLLNGKDQLDYDSSRTYFRGDVVYFPSTSQYYVCHVPPTQTTVGVDPGTNGSVWNSLGTDWIPSAVISVGPNSQFFVRDKNFSDIKNQHLCRENLGILQDLEDIADTYMAKANNLSDVADKDAALRWLGIHPDQLNALYLRRDQRLLDLDNGTSGTQGRDQALTNLSVDLSIKNKVATPGSSSTSWSRETIVSRTSAGDFYARIMYGEATQFRLADLAEYYHNNQNLEPGTIVQFNPDLADKENEVIPSVDFIPGSFYGVVSTAPGVILNSSGEVNDGKVLIALQGRVPCKLYNPNNLDLKRGTPVIPSSVKPGYAEPMVNNDINHDCIGYILNILEDNELVEIKIK